MVSFAGALVLNIGTLTDVWVEAMLLAGRRATALGRPIVLDPVGSGATGLRTRTARRILAETRVSVVRGNASEILSLADVAIVGGKGVDSIHSVEDAGSCGRSIWPARSGHDPGDYRAGRSGNRRRENGPDLRWSHSHAACHRHRLLGHGGHRRLSRRRSGSASRRPPPALAFFGIAGENGRRAGRRPRILSWSICLMPFTPSRPKRWPSVAAIDACHEGGRCHD